MIDRVSIPRALALTLTLTLTLALSLTSTGAWAEAGRPGADARLLGCWEGEGPQYQWGAMVHWRIQRTPDQRFTAHFTVTDEVGDTWSSIEAGTWTFTGVKYQTWLTHVDGEAVDPKDPENAHVYYMRSLSAGQMIYYSPEADLLFQARKVACKVDEHCGQGCTSA